MSGTESSMKGSFAGSVVAVGASAGGLDALERFFSSMPADTGAAFVVIQHLSPDHKSMMGRLLGRHTRMPVQQAAQGMTLRPDHIYLIPPASILYLDGSSFRLAPKESGALNLPIDLFFQSLAETMGPRSIGVVLSGTGSDGTRGAVAINEAGGFLLAQQPDTAGFDSMPLNAMATGLIDAVLPPEDMADRLVDLVHQTRVVESPRRTPASASAEQPAEDELTAVLRELTDSADIDFTEYKEATVRRRVERRMQVRRTRNLGDYRQLLLDDAEECRSLRRELLIGVTRFFRDTEAFEQLNDRVIRPLVRDSRPDTQLRVWAAGVSTGEEVYSLAMLFLEAFDEYQAWPGLKLFATDVHQDHIDIASQGQYPESAAAELSAERVERFLSRQDDTFVVRSELRQCVVFARHNLLTDPPFTRMDLVVCRNTLIYFKPSAQERALERLQYATRDGGFLFLGASESLTANQGDFVTLHQKAKLFQRQGADSTATGEVGGTSPAGQLRDTGDSGSSHRPEAAARYQTTPPRSKGVSDAIDQALGVLVRAYAPPAVLVNEQQELVHVFGDIHRLLRIREGWASLRLNRILPDRLVPVASALIYKALRDDVTVSSDLLRLTDGHDPNDRAELQVRLTAHPVVHRNGTRFALVGFDLEDAEARTSGESELPGDLNVDQETLARVDVLERELAATRESLQATIEELETSNEELQATNEELMASNEELQSSNEELQSVNEELNTVNAESDERIQELHRLNADLDSMAKASGIATVFVDHSLRITRFSPDATALFSLRESDVGRRLDDFSHRLHYRDLVPDLEQTLAEGNQLEKEVEADDGRHFLVRILPYDIGRNQKGAVATFVDITEFSQPS